MQKRGDTEAEFLGENQNHIFNLKFNGCFAVKKVMPTPKFANDYCGVLNRAGLNTVYREAYRLWGKKFGQPKRLTEEIFNLKERIK
jgi:hypothetical protein